MVRGLRGFSESPHTNVLRTLPPEDERLDGMVLVLPALGAALTTTELPLQHDVRIPARAD